MTLLQQDTNLKEIERILEDEPAVFIERDDGVVLMVIREHDGYLAYTIGTELADLVERLPALTDLVKAIFPTQPDDKGSWTVEHAINNPIR